MLLSRRVNEDEMNDLLYPMRVQDKIVFEATQSDGFNEKLIKIMCLNQAI